MQWLAGLFPFLVYQRRLAFQVQQLRASIFPHKQLGMDDIVAPPTATQDAIPALADDLLKDRIRQFLEFLDDEVSPAVCFRG
jgi:hypothetical protein